MDLIINDDNLQKNEIKDTLSKVRAILVDDNNQVLVANYGGVFLFPGGRVDNKEKSIEALIRELREEMGEIYYFDELNYFTRLYFYQKNYPTRNNNYQNRLVVTEFFIGKYKGLNKRMQTLTEKEKSDGFNLQLMTIERLKKIVLENKSDNPRKDYFQKEMLLVLEFYNNNFKNKVK